MSIRNLRHLFAPTSVAVIGASGKPNSVGATVLHNLLVGGFKGAIYPVNPKHNMLEGRVVYHAIGALPAVPELAVICTPADTVPGIIAELGACGTRAAIILTAGLSAQASGSGATLTQAVLDAGRPYTMRILGPNCVGLLVPGIGLNASFALGGAQAGRIAFVSQSGALVTAVLDWANERGIGFSKFISMGDSADVDFGDVLDYLASDPDTGAILMYIEDVRHARKFMSAARAAARGKPTLVLKAGRVPEGARAAASHTGALAGADDVYDAAIRRAGMLRVLSTDALFGAAETLSRAHTLEGDSLAILTNGGGPGVIATDALIAGGGKLASLSAAGTEHLNAALPPTWSHANPVDIVGDAPVERYSRALQILLEDGRTNPILFMHAPTALVPSAEIASALAPMICSTNRTVLSCWLGGHSVAQARHVFSSSGIPVFDTPEEAVGAFLQMVQYRQNQALLMQVPPAASEIGSNRSAAKAIVQAAQAAGRSILSEPETKAVLAAYNIPVAATRVAASLEEALAAAGQIGFPLALKIISPDITHKSEVGGVALDLDSPLALQAAAEDMAQRLARLSPAARLAGFSVQQMVRRPNAHELIVGVATDPVFGPVILFGQGGVAVEVINDRAVGLPPLNRVLARDLVERTRAARLLAGYRNRAPADMEAILDVLVQVSQLAIDLPELAELDINPLLADAAGAVVLDARMVIRSVADVVASPDRLAIRPYPSELVEQCEWQGQALVLRPVRPEDGPAHTAFFAALTPEDVRYRMFVRMRDLSHSQLARFTQIDYDREMAFIATRDGQTLGVVRAVADPDNVEAEFAITVRSDLSGRGLGLLLMNKLIPYCRSRGTRVLVGETLPQNARLLALVRKLGFEEHGLPNRDAVQLRLRLD